MKVCVLHCVASLAPSHGGPSRTVIGLTDALARSGGANVTLLSQASPGAPSMPSGERVFREDVVAPSRIGQVLAWPLRRWLQRSRSEAGTDLVHSHGLWQPANHWAASFACARQVPLVIHPRGMLDPWALGQKKFKKRMALALFQKQDLRAASALVASSEMEYESVRRFGLRQPVAVIPNGIDTPPGIAPVELPRATDRRRTALFMSRIHRQKGVLELVRAWASAAPSGWRLIIAGPDDHGHWATVASLVDELGLRDVVDYLGPVEGARKTAAFRDADVFILPSFSESFGMAVAEALAHGLPVITTRGTPWSDLLAHRCGWWIDAGVDPLSAALREATGLSDSDRHLMGERGRHYVRRFDWDAIAGETLALYHWLLQRADRPACLRLD